MKRVAVDIGGTFTDCFVCWDDRFLQAKALTTHQNLALGFNEALDSACNMLGLARSRVLSEVDSVRYATTLGTNALIERKGPRVGLLTTHGFESTVPISRGRGYAEGLAKDQVRDLPRAQRPLPLVPPALIRVVRERVNYRGEILMDLDEPDCRQQIRRLMQDGVQAIVVALVNSVSNPEHELRVQEIFMEEYPPQMLGAIPLILSHQVVGRKGEYVRTTSAIIDAYLHSTMYFAMTALEQNLRENGYQRPMLLVHNSGGMAQLNSTDALRTLHSGPVAGIHAAETLSRQGGLGNVVCGDMGGTSFDIGIVVKGGDKHYDFSPVVDRWLVSLPMVHLVTLGAGGGSIAKYDPVFRAITVGPESAGSDPGPACYNRGGMYPTVTDADLLLGYLDPTFYADGRIKLSARRSRNAIGSLSQASHMEDLELAKLIRQRADGNMASGIVRELNAHGYIPSEFTFLAYGGNGPLHACGIADAAGITKVLAPPYSAVFSASGASGLNQMHIHEKNVSIALYNKSLRTIYGDFASFNAMAEQLESLGRKDLERQDVPDDRILYRLELDLRYGIQKMEISIVAPRQRLGSSTEVLSLIEMMNSEFGKRYGEDVVSPESGVWVTTIRVVSWAETPTLRFEDMMPPTVKQIAPAPVAVRRCHFVHHAEPLDTPVYGPGAFEPGVRIEGPAIVNPGSTTYLVEPGWAFEAAAQGAVWFTRQSDPHATRGSRE